MAEQGIAAEKGKDSVPTHKMTGLLVFDIEFNLLSPWDCANIILKWDIQSA